MARLQCPPSQPPPGPIAGLPGAPSWAAPSVLILLSAHAPHTPVDWIQLIGLRIHSLLNSSYSSELSVRTSAMEDT